MTFNVRDNQVECDPILIRYFCDECGFEEWKDKVDTKLKCECEYYVQHEIWEG